jgi:hypothetical protein
VIVYNAAMKNGNDRALRSGNTKKSTQKSRRSHNAVLVGLPEATARSVLKWARLRGISGAKALRHLVERGLKTERPQDAIRSNTKHQASRASHFADRTIKNMSDASASKKEQQERRQRLTKGPAEFRAIRKRTQKLRERTNRDSRQPRLSRRPKN